MVVGIREAILFRHRRERPAGPSVADLRLGSVTNGKTGRTGSDLVTRAVTLLERSAVRLLVKRLTKEDAMRQTHKALATLALGLALVTATTAAAAATLPTGTRDQGAQRKALYQAELDRNLRQRTQAGNEAAVGQRLTGQHRALYQSELARNLATATAADRAAIRPSAQTDPAASGPDVVATLLVGLVGGLVGGAAAMLGWTAITRGRRPRVAVGT
jgi:hypothetical protein